MSSSTLAILGGTPVGKVESGRHPRFSDEAIQRVADLLRNGTTVGLNKNCAEIEEAERSVAEWQGVPHCLGTASGHAALHSALIGLEISYGDEVITTPYTWGASISCILHNNAIPVFADIDPLTGLLDPASVAERITDRTRAILVVHLFGQAVDMTEICRIAGEHDLVVIEDGSQAHGALHDNRKVGTFGDAAGFSCMGGKLLATSEAGYMVTPKEEVYWKAAMGGQHMGRSPESGFPSELQPYADSLVYTYRLNPINAVLLTEQLKKVDEEIAERRRSVATLRSLMSDVGSVVFPEHRAGDDPSYHLITMNFVPETAGVGRDTYIKALIAEGVPIFAYVPSPIPRWPRLQWQDYKGPRVMWTEVLKAHGVDYSKVELPQCDHKAAHSLEMGWNYFDDDEPAIRRIAEAFHKVESNLDALREWDRKQG